MEQARPALATTPATTRPATRSTTSTTTALAINADAIAYVVYLYASADEVINNP